MTDRQTDGRTGKNNMFPDPLGEDIIQVPKACHACTAIILSFKKLWEKTKTKMSLFWISKDTYKFLYIPTQDNINNSNTPRLYSQW